MTKPNDANPEIITGYLDPAGHRPLTEQEGLRYFEGSDLIYRVIMPPMESVLRLFVRLDPVLWTRNAN